MATNSYIGYQDDAGKFHVVYCHYDGYLSHNGKILFEHYTTLEKVMQLVTLGNMSSLGKDIAAPFNVEHTFENPQKDVCVFYGRDRGERNQWPDKCSHVFELRLKTSGTATYIFKDNKWFFSCKDGFTPLEEYRETMFGAA